MELMQKYCKDDGVVGVENLDRWPIDSKAVTFLSETTSAISVHELIKVIDIDPLKGITNLLSIL